MAACKYLSKSVLGKAVAPSQLRSGAGKTDVFEFKKVLPKVVQDLTDSGSYLDVPAATKRLAKILQYNVTGGKKNRGLGVVVSYRMLANEEDLTAENLELAHLMGWAIGDVLATSLETYDRPALKSTQLHGSLLMTQDSLDQVETRRGKPCWYLTPQTTPLVAINDANLLVTAIYQLLKTHFKNQPYYVDVIELFQDVCHKATMGQVIDIETRADKTLQQFTMERYKAITKYKTVYHTFQMPVSLALYMAGIQDIEIHRQAKTILMEMGQFYQVMADYMNCYMEGDEGFGARSGSDIEDGKCTWLAVVALQRASNQQKIHLQDGWLIIMASAPSHERNAAAANPTVSLRLDANPTEKQNPDRKSHICMPYATFLPGNKTLPPDTDDGTVLELVDKRCGPKKFRGGECYGSKDPAKISQVKELYDALGLPVTYKQYEEQTYDLLCTQIQQISRGLPHKLFFRFLDNVYVKNVTNEIN
uniref:Farnesyl pyrophosphate synthase n=1 Tax=Timema genevievae TaxID=629358 RepID=A0A7R9JWG0_TIMGE|nr:unnamed protein product [Timema genevievae]